MVLLTSHSVNVFIIFNFFWYRNEFETKDDEIKSKHISRALKEPIWGVRYRYDLSQEHITPIAICRKRFFSFSAAAEPSLKSETSSSTMFMFTPNLLDWLGVWAKSVSVLLIERLRNPSMHGSKHFRGG